MRKQFFLGLFAALSMQYASAQTSDLSVPKIMQDPKWMGTFPSKVQWDQQGETVYFEYNKEGDPADSLYKIQVSTPTQIEKVSLSEKKSLHPNGGVFNRDRSKKLYVKDGSLMLHDIAKNESQTLVDLGNRISNPMFVGEHIAFESGQNLYTVEASSGKLKKITNINSGSRPKEKNGDKSEKDKWLKEDNLELLQVIKEREEKKEKSDEYKKQTTDKEKFTFYADNKGVSSLSLSPDLKYVTFTLVERISPEGTDVPDYADATGYTVNLPARPKVGQDASKMQLAVYDLERDTVIITDMSTLEGIQDLPDYTSDYPDKEWEKKDREVIPAKVHFSEDSEHAVLSIRSQDNKDRWIAKLDLQESKISTLDRQRDEAWIAGPGIGYAFGGGTFGWLPDNQHVYFQSEASGYSHLYLLDINTGQKKALTQGEYEVFNPKLSNDQKHWYLTTSEVHPGERHFYKMPVMGGEMEKLTHMEGNNDVSLSPDEKHMAILHSYSNKPWELYLQPLGEEEAQQVTEGQSEEFKSYEWREPELVQFQAEDGEMVWARLYKPEVDKSNGAGVIFVHGAGYLQNVHKWWSNYFREYMFHNLLTDLGYTVLDIDYRGSAGYGRDWRTSIYRHMGGKDLSDHVDGAKFLADQHGVDPERMGIYGGSYGGFITLMALFNEPEYFHAGAALRSVTDWAHYNHGYTSNILNEPINDPIAYRRSSPIYFAEGLQGHLLIAHGIVDVNVHFQDVVRLAQRLIELEKDNWEMAVYPVEDHGFVEPSSWTDEYKRILKLFNDNLLK
ncbi:S9 family peptidase [Litoribacter populi]|uniref:S9 family peptidase n=1 Tax=Litoribacter populi TaxID=2598460 RepID=UPI00117F921C|nr:S9 family peptidase [Litoribacter populi]